MEDSRFQELHMQVLARISPSDNEKNVVATIVTELKEKILAEAKKLNLELEPILGGSVAKDTAVRPLDIDLFMLFQPETSREELERFGLLIGRKILPAGTTKYAEHPYVMGSYKGYEVELVPGYKIKSPGERLSAVDRTPFHTQYIKSHLREAQKNEVRLLKQFLKCLGIYGAEAEIEGFSGYLCELLVLKYDTFLNMLRNVQRRWRQKVVVRLGNEKLLAEFQQPIVVIDPVDARRNAAAAVSEHSLALLIHAAKAYLHAPSEIFFFAPELKVWSKKKLVRELELRGTRLLGLKFPAPDIIPDILHPQIRRCQRQLSQLLEQHEFKLVHTNFFVNAESVIIIWELLSDQLPAVKKHYGPFVWHRNAPKFLQKWAEDPRALSAVYIENGRFAVDIRREFTEATKRLESGIERLNLGKNLNELLKSKCQIIPHTRISALPRVLLTRFFNKKMPWDV